MLEHVPAATGCFDSVPDGVLHGGQLLAVAIRRLGKPEHIAAPAAVAPGAAICSGFPNRLIATARSWPPWRTPSGTESKQPVAAGTCSSIPSTSAGPPESCQPPSSPSTPV